MEFRWAEAEDIDLLVQTRIMVLRDANGLSDDADLDDVAERARDYYLKSLADGRHAAVFAMDKGRVVAAGGVSFYQVLPTCCCPTGMKAYIMNMYTAPEYRRQGIANRILDMLVQVCREKGIDFISLEATAMGRPLYEKYGFIPMMDEMILTK